MEEGEINKIMAHRNVGFLLRNGHSPGGRIVPSLQVLKTFDGTLNLI
jgi:hypothetical protein